MTKYLSLTDKKTLLFDVALFILVFVLFSFFRPDIVLVALWICIYPYFLLTKRPYILKNLLLSTAIGFFWSVVSKDYIRYEQNFITIAGCQLFVMCGWSLGLVFGHLIYSFLEKRLPIQRYYQELLLFIGIYFILLIAVETTGYHAFNIQNVQTASSSGLPLLNSIHGPCWLKCGYFLSGLIYFAFYYTLFPKHNHRTAWFWTLQALLLVTLALFWNVQTTTTVLICLAGLASSLYTGLSSFRIAKDEKTKDKHKDISAYLPCCLAIAWTLLLVTKLVL